MDVQNYKNVSFKNFIEQQSKVEIEDGRVHPDSLVYIILYH